MSSDPPAETLTRQYDKFGFLIAANQESRIADFEEPKSSSSRRKSPYKDRKSSDFSPRKSRMDRHDKRDERRRRYSPDLGDFSKDRKREERREFMDHSDNWESSFLLPPPAPFVPPLTTPAFSEPIAPSYPPPSYGHFNTVQYSGFSDIPPMEGSHEMLQAPPAPTVQWGQLPPPAPVITTSQDEQVKREAIASEMRNQRATLARQKEEYTKKATVLKRELESLKEQRTELRGDSRRSPSPDSLRFLKENAKLQVEIQTKLKTMNSVIDMLNGIIGDKTIEGDTSSDKSKRKGAAPRTPVQSPPSSQDSSTENDKNSSRHKKRKSRSKSRSTGDKKFNCVYYDPEMHWCRLCNEFPSTAKDYLNHLHTPHHHRSAAAHLEAPWHSATNQNEGMPSYPGAPNKRFPIKGLQFFVPSTAWYCKLCDQWIGDLHCASAHLKSLMHSQNYTNFIELNPHWEMDWMSDRQKSFEKHRKGGNSTVAPSNAQGTADAPQYAPHTISFQADGFHTKHKKANSENPGEENTIPLQINNKKSAKTEKKPKKKKDSSSDTSDSSASSSDSAPEEKKAKKETSSNKANWKPESGDTAAEDKMLAQWMSLQDHTFSEHDSKILETLKNRVKTRGKVEQRVDGRVVSREREARELLSIRAERVRLEANKAFEREEKDSKEHRKRKDKYQGRDRDYDNDRNSSRSGQRSGGDSSEFKPYVKRESQDQNETRFDKQLSEKSSRKQSSNSNSTSDSKKMPFIGKMPLYKSLTNKAPSKQDSEGSKQGESSQECFEAAKKKRDEINAQIQKSVAEFKEKLKTSLAKHDENGAELPAPGLALPTALGGMPPPILSDPVPPKPSVPISFPQTIHRIQKPPAFTSAVVVAPPTPPATVPKAQVKTPPTSLPGAKNDSLHKDFQDALDIIFPSENSQKKDDEEEARPSSPQLNESSQSTDMVMNSDPNLHLLSQIPPPGYQAMPPMMAGMPPMGAQGYPHPMAQMGPPPMGMMGHQAQMGMMMGYDYSGGMYGASGMYDMSQQHYTHTPKPATPVVSSKAQDMEDLAMLGIDAEDIGASGF